MPRPARAIWVARTYARRRHRSWMLAMSLATVGWSAWWLALLLHRLDVGLAPGFRLTTAVSTSCAILGLGIAILTLRARRTWILFALFPLFANASLLGLPWLVGRLLSGD
jgi:hypothetical protein